MSDVPVRPAKVVSWLLALAGAGLLTAGAAVVGVLYFNRPPDAPHTPPPPPLSDEELDRQVHVFCEYCHKFPPPETFPRSDWKYEVEQAYGFFETYAPPLHPPPIDPVVKYFADKAPAELPPAQIERASGGLPVRFEPVSIPTAPGESPPVISNVNLVHLYDDHRLDILATDMQHGQVMVLQPYLPEPTWKVLATLKNPAHTEVVDLDGDGINDILVADLGNFYPTDGNCGSVVWLRGKPNHEFDPPVTLLKGVGRVADAQAADFRGVGKKDVVVGVFGWQKTGEILYLENETKDWSRPVFTPRVLDDRHGTIHVPVCDLHGDGRKDFIALISQEHETVVAFLNDGKGHFEKQAIFTGPHPAYGSSGIQVVDLNGDGLPDVLYTNGDVLDKPYLLKPYHSVQWLENPGPGKFPWVHHPLTPMYGVHRAVAADLVGDHKMDVAAVCFLPAGSTRDEGFPERETLKPDSFILLQQTGPGRFARHSLETTTCDHVTCAAGDVYGTGRMDIVVGNFSPRKPMPAITIWKNLGRPAARGVEGGGWRVERGGLLDDAVSGGTNTVLSSLSTLHPPPSTLMDLPAPPGGGRRLCPRLLAPGSSPPGPRAPARNAGPDAARS